MYMIYKLADFRKSTRTAFNLADSGETVEVVRYGKIYRLIVTEHNLVDSPDTYNKEVFKARHEAGDRRPIGGFCKNGHSIPDGREKCLRKGCKYA